MLAEIDCFVNWMRRRNPDARTWRDYSYDLKQFVAVVGDRPPESITLHDVDRFVISQADRGFKPATINRRLAAITSLYTFLSDDNPTLICPVLPHRHGLRRPQRLPRPVREESLSKFFAVIDSPRDRAMFLGSLGFRGIACRRPELVRVLRVDTPTSWGLQRPDHAKSQRACSC